MFKEKSKRAYRPSEHPPVRGGKCQTKRLGGIKGCKNKTSFMAFERVPRITLSQQYNVAEKPIVVFIPSPALLQKNKQASDWVDVRCIGRR